MQGKEHLPTCQWWSL